MDVEYHGKYEIHWIAKQPLDLETLLIGNFFVKPRPASYDSE